MDKIHQSILYLDDIRRPTAKWIKWVRNYEEFVSYLEEYGPPDLISFDHDLSLEHYPLFEKNPGAGIPYGAYVEKTGYDCAKYVVENAIPIRHWTVHSFNPVGKTNIERLLRDYCPEGETQDKVKYHVVERVDS